MSPKPDAIIEKKLADETVIPTARSKPFCPTSPRRRRRLLLRLRRPCLSAPAAITVAALAAPVARVDAAVAVVRRQSRTPRRS